MSETGESPFKDVFYFKSIEAGYFLFLLSSSDLEKAQKRGYITQMTMEYLIFSEIGKSPGKIGSFMFTSAEYLAKEELPSPIPKTYILVPYLKDNNNNWSLLLFDSVFNQCSSNDCRKEISHELTSADILRNEIIIFQGPEKKKTILTIPKTENSANACFSFIKEMFECYKGADAYINNMLKNPEYSRKNIKRLVLDGNRINTSETKTKDSPIKQSITNKTRMNKDSLSQREEKTQTMKMFSSNKSINSSDKTHITARIFQHLTNDLSIEKRASSKPSSAIDIMFTYGDEMIPFDNTDTCNQTSLSDRASHTIVNINNNAIPKPRNQTKNRSYSDLLVIMKKSNEKKTKLIDTLTKEANLDKPLGTNLNGTLNILAPVIKAVNNEGSQKEQCVNRKLDFSTPARTSNKETSQSDQSVKQTLLSDSLDKGEISCTTKPKEIIKERGICELPSKDNTNQDNKARITSDALSHKAENPETMKMSSSIESINSYDTTQNGFSINKKNQEVITLKKEHNVNVEERASLNTSSKAYEQKLATLAEQITQIKANSIQ